MEKRRVKPASGLRAQVVVFRVCHDSDDCKIKCPERRGGSDLSTERVRLTKVGPSHRLIDDRNERRISFILPADLAAEEKWSPQSREIAGSHIIHHGAHLLARRRSI